MMVWATEGERERTRMAGALGRDGESVTERRTTTVVVVDDHATVAELLCRALSSEPDLTCLGSAHSFADGEALVTALRPDVAVLDARLGDGDGVELAAKLTSQLPDLRVVIFTGYADADLAAAAAEAGVGWLLSKQGSLDRLLASVRAAPRENLVVDPTLFLEISRPVAGATAPPRLTRREHEVLQLLAEGLDTRGIARKLNISVNTCRGYIKSLLARLGAHSQLQAVAIATGHGLVRPRPSNGNSGYRPPDQR
jgi:DNA-binding NarL/FixJ family response regulator